MSIFSIVGNSIPPESANKISSEALLTIISEAKKEGVGLDQLSTLSITTFVLSIQPTIERIIAEQGREALVTYMTNQMASLNVAKETLLNIMDNIKVG